MKESSGCKDVQGGLGISVEIDCPDVTIKIKVN